MMVDVRPGCLEAEWVRTALHSVLTAVIEDKSMRASPSKLHISVALASRGVLPMRVLLQGWVHQSSQVGGPLLDHLKEHLTRAAAEFRNRALGKARGAGARPHSFQSCMRQALFCLSMLPERASPALALITGVISHQRTRLHPPHTPPRLTR